MAMSAARIYAVNLDFNDFSGPRYRATLRTYLKDKYFESPIGVMFAVGSSALEFALQLRSEQWPDIPIVFAAADEDSVTKIIDSATTRNVTGRTLRFSLTRSVEVARALVPGLKQIALVGDPLERQPFRRHFKEELRQATANLALIDLTGLPLAQVRGRVATLSSDTAILYTAITDDGTGTSYLPYEAIEAIAEVANRPIVVDVDNRIGRGGTGGPVVRPTLIGEEAAQLVARIFNGEAASEIPIVVSESIRPVFDWRQLQRWQIAEAQLPPDSELHFRELRVWEQYRTQIILIAMTVLFQSALIGGLLCEDRRRRTAETRSLALATELAHLNRVATAGELTASIAHEIRQPLAGIVARANAGLNWLKRTTPDLDKVRNALESIVDNGHRAGEVLRNTRAMFQKGETPQATLNVNQIVNEVLALISRKIAESDIKLVTSYVEMPVPMVRANRVQLQQVLLNLAMNAIEAMGTMRNGDRILSLTTEVNQAGHVVIAVQDSGPGIDTEHIDQIFKSFFTTKPDGMGLGLSICKTSIESHGGVLTVSQGDPVGMIFTIDLPLMTRRQWSAATDAKPVPDWLSTGHPR
jgi:signal transduction histidine kinase